MLPSSVHETTVLPPKDEAEYEWLADMVREVNDTQADIEERLPYHVYVYSRYEETLKIVAWQQGYTVMGGIKGRKSCR